MQTTNMHCQNNFKSDAQSSESRRASSRVEPSCPVSPITCPQSTQGINIPNLLLNRNFAKTQIEILSGMLNDGTISFATWQECCHRINWVWDPLLDENEIDLKINDLKK